MPQDPRSQQLKQPQQQQPLIQDVLDNPTVILPPGTLPVSSDGTPATMVKARNIQYFVNDYRLLPYMRLLTYEFEIEIDSFVGFARATASAPTATSVSSRSSSTSTTCFNPSPSYCCSSHCTTAAARKNHCQFDLT